MLSQFTDAWKSFCSPARQTYCIFDLGPKEFKVLGHSCQRRDFNVRSSRGHKLEGSFYAMEEVFSGDCVVFLHSFNGSRLESIKFVEAVLERGCAFCHFDFAACGLSSGEYVSMGFFEQYDVQEVVEHIQTHFQVKSIGLWGRSMGAVTALLYSQKFSRAVEGLVVDSAFVNMYETGLEVADLKTPMLPNFIVKEVVEYVRKKTSENVGFDMKAVDTMKGLDSCRGIPVLFVASKQDTLVPSHNTESLFKKYPAESSSNKKVLYVAGDHNEPRGKEVISQIAEFITKCIVKDDKQNGRQPIIPKNPWANGLEKQKQQALASIQRLQKHRDSQQQLQMTKGSAIALAPAKEGQLSKGKKTIYCIGENNQSTQQMLGNKSKEGLTAKKRFHAVSLVDSASSQQRRASGVFNEGLERRSSHDARSFSHVPDEMEDDQHEILKLQCFPIKQSIQSRQITEPKMKMTEGASGSTMMCSNKEQQLQTKSRGELESQSQCEKKIVMMKGTHRSATAATVALLREKLAGAKNQMVVEVRQMENEQDSNHRTMVTDSFFKQKQLPIDDLYRSVSFRQSWEEKRAPPSNSNQQTMAISTMKDQTMASMDARSVGELHNHHVPFATPTPHTKQKWFGAGANVSLPQSLYSSNVIAKSLSEKGLLYRMESVVPGQALHHETQSVVQGTINTPLLDNLMKGNCFKPDKEGGSKSTSNSVVGSLGVSKKNLGQKDQTNYQSFLSNQTSISATVAGAQADSHNFNKNGSINKEIEQPPHGLLSNVANYLTTTSSNRTDKIEGILNVDRPVKQTSNLSNCSSSTSSNRPFDFHSTNHFHAHNKIINKTKTSSLYLDNKQATNTQLVGQQSHTSTQQIPNEKHSCSVQQTSATQVLESFEPFLPFGAFYSQREKLSVKQPIYDQLEKPLKSTLFLEESLLSKVINEGTRQVKRQGSGEALKTVQEQDMQSFGNLSLTRNINVNNILTKGSGWLAPQRGDQQLIEKFSQIKPSSSTSQLADYLNPSTQLLQKNSPSKWAFKNKVNQHQKVVETHLANRLQPDIQQIKLKGEPITWRKAQTQIED